MKTKYEYRVVTSENKYAFADIVEELLNDGWMLAGGVSAVCTPVNIYTVQLYQALQREVVE
jgi:hypothetical protein